jgi:hypothetical protein
MSRKQLESYQAAVEHGPSKSAATMKAAMRDLQAEVENGPKRGSNPPLEERFNIVSRLLGKEYQFRDQPGKVAFSENLFRLRSDSDSPAAIKAMVDRAAERGWETIRVTGTSEFQRQAWIAATAQGIKTVGYSPTVGDRQAAAKEKTRIEMSRVLREPQARGTGDVASQAARDPVTGSTGDRAGVSRASSVRVRAVGTALEKAFRDAKVPPNKRAQILDQVIAEAARRAGRGERINVPVYDARAPRAKPRTIKVGPQRTSERERSR